MNKLSLIFTAFFFSLVLPTPGAVAQPSVAFDVTMRDGRVFTDKVPLYTLSNTEAVALADMCYLLKFQFSESATLMSIFTSERDTCVLRAENHFAVLQRGGIADIVQLGGAPIASGEKIYLAPKHIAKLLALWLGASASYDATTKKLMLAFKPTQRDTIARPPVALTPTPKSDTAKPPVLLPPALDSLDKRYTISKLTVEEKANGAIIRIFSTVANLKYEFIAPDKSGVAYLTFVNATGNPAALSQSFKDGFLKRSTALRLKSGALQLTFEFNTKKYKLLSSDFSAEKGTNNFVMLVLREANVQEILQQDEKGRKINETLERDRDKWKLDVIALDAGHGGKDPGAIGATGKYEKHVALGIVLKLGKLIEKNMPDVKVVYTRKTDVFVELDERGKIANQAGAKLFVSVHCNANLNKKADGSEVYLLGLHKTDAALGVAQRENAVILEESDYKTRYKNFTDENLIMITMAQNAFLQQSERLAEFVSANMAERTTLEPRGVKQAGFMVLWTPSMPSILVETGYITNADDEKFLTSDDGQQKIAQAIFEAIKKYRDDYESR